MKNTIFLVLFLFTLTNALSGQSWTSSNKIYSSTNVSAVQTTSGPDEALVTLGTFSGTLNSNSAELLTSFGSRDYYVVKFTDLGEIDWINQLGSTGNDYVGGGICACFDGNVYVAGGFRNDLQYSPASTVPNLTSTGGFDIFLAKYDSNGTLLWCENIGSGALNQRPNSLKVDKSGNVLVGGFFTDSITIDVTTTLYSDDGVDDFFYSKFDADGNLLWAKQIRSFESTNSGRIFTIDATDNSYFFAGIFADSVIFENDTIVSHNNSYDIHLFKSNLNGDVDWIRRIGGKDADYTYSIVADQNNNVYLAGYYLDTDTLFIDENETDVALSIGQSKGESDFVVAKYDVDGNLLWYNEAGGKGLDKLNDIILNSDQVVVSGYFADTIMWGGVELSTEGLADIDMFVGELTTDGNYRSANSYGGINNSFESARSLYYGGGKQHTIIRSNSELLVLGDSIYVSSGGVDYIVYGTVGCLPIDVDANQVNAINCFGDSTGSILIEPTGGFAGTWQYSVDNGDNYSTGGFIQDLPAGDYQVVVIDGEGCSEVGPLISLIDPDTLLAIVDYKQDILVDTTWNGIVEISDGLLSIIANGGNGGYTYQLLPDGDTLGIGYYEFAYEDSGKYVVAVNDSKNCGPSNTDTIEINVIYSSALGVGDFGAAEVKIYPNPTSGIVTVEMPYEGKRTKLEVISMTGQTVLKRKVFPNGGVITETIDLSDQAKGLYMVRIDGQSLPSAVVVK